MKYRLLIISLAAILFFGCNPDNEVETLFKLKASSETGVTFNNQIIETDSSNILNEEYIFNGGGVAVGDFNADGQTDLFFSGNQVSNKLYLNKGNFHFQDISEQAGIEAKDRWSTGVTVVDINTDGKLDIYVCAAREDSLEKRANLLFVNQGNDENGIPQFKELAQEYGINEKGNSMGAAFFDYDKDGLLDLYVINNEQIHILPTNYRKKVVDGSAVTNDRLYHNNGDGTFTDVTLEAGITIEGFGLGLAISDLNYDGWPDIYINNDYLTNDLLYINNGDGTFSNNIEKLIKHQSKFSMGSDIADYNNDGYLDIITLDMLGETNYRMKTTIMGNNYINYVLNERWDYQYQYMRNMLQLGNGGNTPYNEIGLLSGVSKTDWSWSPLFVDADNDGYRDLLITNGFPRDITDMDFSDFRLTVSQFLSPEKILDSIPVVKIANYAYRNNGDLTFENKTSSWGLDIPSFSNGAAYVDLDKDGDMDYVVNNINDEAFIFENTLDKNEVNTNFLNVELRGDKNNPFGIGAKLLLQYDDQKQYYEHHITRGYMSSVEKTVHFGLGDHTSASLQVLWPDGKHQEITNISPNQVLSVSYSEAIPINTEESFSLVSKKPETTYFSEVSDSLGINYVHKEQDIVDYNVQRTLPHKLTQNGPCLAVGDFNGDQLEDFIIGSSAKYSPILFLQDKFGKFTSSELFMSQENKAYEEESIAVFDLENDGDLDLYLVSGSNEFEAGSKLYQDRLLVNDGKGNFTEVWDKSPVIKSSGSIVEPLDFDKDGFVDLFIGGRTPFGEYPLPDQSFLLKNVNGILTDVTTTYAPGLQNIGMVTDAVWADVDNDTLEDLIVVGEFMAITVFKNESDSFTKLENTNLEGYLGWWESISKGDFDGDGDMDFIVGNMGRNNFYQPSKEHPVTLLSKDFDKNGSIDPIMFAYYKNKNGDYASYPFNFWGDINKQSTLFRAKFNLYKEFASATDEKIFNAKELEGANKLTGNFDRSIYIENLGNGTFQIEELPIEAQFAPINAIVPMDYNLDGKLDVLLVGNDFGNEIFVGRLDGLNGLLLEGNGKGKFKSVNSAQSGFVVPGDAKSLGEIKTSNGQSLIIATQNKDKALIFKKN